MTRCRMPYYSKLNIYLFQAIQFSTDLRFVSKLGFFVSICSVIFGSFSGAINVGSFSGAIIVGPFSDPLNM